MSWDQFSYICRKANSLYNPKQSIVDCLTQIEHEPNSRLYGGHIKFDSLCRKNLNDFEKIKDPLKAKLILGTYSQLDISHHLSKPQYLDSTLKYLIALVLVFFILNMILQFKVMPTLISTLTTAGITLPEMTTFYNQYWAPIMIAPILLLSAAIFITYFFRKLLKLEEGGEPVFLLSFLVFKDIQASYEKIKSILSYPVQSAIGHTAIEGNAVYQHLSEIEDLGMDLPQAMQSLINSEYFLLNKQCENHIQWIETVLTLVISSAISLFIISTYLPIFNLGSIV